MEDLDEEFSRRYWSIFRIDVRLVIWRFFDCIDSTDYLHGPRWGFDDNERMRMI